MPIIPVLRESEAGGSEVQGHPGLYSKSRDSMGYMISYLKKEEQKQERGETVI